MPVNYVIYMSVVWTSAFFISLLTIALFQYRRIMVFKDVWRLLLLALAMYCTGFTLAAITYTVALAYGQETIMIMGSKSVPGIIAISIAFILLTFLCIIAAYTVKSCEGGTTIDKLIKDPILPCLIALGAIASTWAIASPKEALVVKLNGGGTVVYTNEYLILLAVIVALSLYPTLKAWIYSGKSLTLRDFSLAVKLLAILIFLQLLIGYDAMLISSLLRVDAYPSMNMIFMVSSFIGVGVLYSELLRPLAHVAKPPIEAKPKALELTGL